MKIKILKIITCFTLALAIVLTCLPVTAYATSTSSGKKYTYNLSVTKITNEIVVATGYNTTCNDKAEEYKYDVVIESDYPCVATTTYNMDNKYGQYIGTLSDSYDEHNIGFYTLDSSGNVTKATLKVVRVFKYNRNNNTWEIDTNNTTTTLSNVLGLSQYYIASTGNNLKCLYLPNTVTTYTEDISSTATYNVTQNIQSYLLTGKLSNMPDGVNGYALGNTSKIQFIKYTPKYSAVDNWAFGSTLYNVKISDDGIVTWDMPVQTESCLYKGIEVVFRLSGSKSFTWYRTVPMDNSFKINIPKDADITHIYLAPYYVTQSGRFLPFSNAPTITLDKNASYYQSDGSEPLITIESRLDNIPPSVIPDADFDGGSGEGDGSNSDSGNEEDYSDTYPEEMLKENTLGYLQNVKMTRGYNLVTGIGESNDLADNIVYKISWDTDIEKFLGSYIEVYATCLYKKSYRTIPVITKENMIGYKNIPVSIKSGDVKKICGGSTLIGYDCVIQYFYVRAVKYDADTGQYLYGGFVRIEPNQLSSVPITTVQPSGDNSTFVPNINSDDSYATDDKFGSGGNSFDSDSLTSLTDNSLSWTFGSLKSISNALGEFPYLVSSVFSFLPSECVIFVALCIGLNVILRIIGR